MSLEIDLTASSGPELGKLLLGLALWMADRTIDLAEDKHHFTPPQNTQAVLPPQREMPSDVCILASLETTYSV